MRTLINRKTLGKKIFFLVNVCGNGRVCLMEPAWSQSETSLQMVAADAAASSTAGALSRMDEWEGWVTAWITYMHGLICCCGYRWLDVENSPEINLKTRWRRNFIYSWFVCLLPAGQTQVSSAVNTLCEELTRWRQADIPPLSEPASPMGGGGGGFDWSQNSSTCPCVRQKRCTCQQLCRRQRHSHPERPRPLFTGSSVSLPGSGEETGGKKRPFGSPGKWIKERRERANKHFSCFLCLMSFPKIMWASENSSDS